MFAVSNKGKLHLKNDRGFVSEYAAVMIQWLETFDINYVMGACLWQFISVWCHSARRVYGVFSQRNKCPARRSSRSREPCVSQPSFPFCSVYVCYTAYLYRLRVNAEVTSAYVHFLSHTAVYQFLKTAYRFAAVVELTTGYEIRNQVVAFLSDETQTDGSHCLSLLTQQPCSRLWLSDPKNGGLSLDGEYFRSPII